MTFEEIVVRYFRTGSTYSPAFHRKASDFLANNPTVEMRNRLSAPDQLDWGNRFKIFTVNT